MKDREDWEDWAATLPKGGAPPSCQCSCGRFARFLGERCRYNGIWEETLVDVECSRCGLVTVSM